MTLPKDPIILLSYVNTQLRDNFPSLAELAAAAMVDENEIASKLAMVGYAYDHEKNRFI
ncbi:MAG: DUF4250 domain-containing protein [Lachnospiraceae bacterium]|nr:DUF4250 domain-containing protein [Lachnospiraceae bacterium]